MSRSRLLIAALALVLICGLAAAADAGSRACTAHRAPDLGVAAESGAASDIALECGAFDGEYWGPDGGSACVNVHVKNTGDCRVDITYPTGSGGFSVEPGRERGRQVTLSSGQYVGYHCAVGEGNCNFTITITACTVKPAEL